MPLMPGVMRLNLLNIFRKAGGKKFHIGDKVIVSTEGGWKENYTGVVAAKVGLTGKVKTRKGLIYMYWIDFDDEAYDLDGDGPYYKAQVLSLYLEPAP